MNISEKIDLLRERRGVSLTHLNKAIGAYRGKITDVKSGKTSFTEREISILASELSTSTDYLLGNTDDPTPVGQEKAPTHESERELPHAEYREVLAEGGMRLLMDADAKIPEEHVEEIVEFIKMKQRKYGR